MTREQALKDYVDCEMMIDSLMTKKQNLKKIILGELLPPAPEIKRKEQPRTEKGSRGQTQGIVGQTLLEHGGKLSQKEIVTLTELSKGQVNGAMYKLLSKGMVHKIKQGTSTFWSIAVHKDRSELNHI